MTPQDFATLKAGELVVLRPQFLHRPNARLYGITVAPHYDAHGLLAHATCIDDPVVSTIVMSGMIESVVPDPTIAEIAQNPDPRD